MAVKNTKLGGTDWTNSDTLNAADINDTFDAINSSPYKYGTGTYTDNDTSQTFTDSFCSTTSLVVVEITSGTAAQGIWEVDSAGGNFTITSTTNESNDITFKYFIVKNI